MTDSSDEPIQPTPPGRNFFCKENVRKDIKGKSVRGGLFSMGAQGISFCLNMARIMILARLLTKADFGLVAMVMVVVQFAMMLKDAGLSMATVQRDTITHEQVSTLFWINLGVSFFLSSLIVVFSPLVSMFYATPELTPLTMGLGLSVLCSGVAAQHQALLRRQMQFGRLAISRISMQSMNLLVATLFAYHGFGPWALVWGMVAGMTVSSILCFVLCPWVPGRPRRGQGVRSLAVFGSHVAGGNLAAFIGNNIDKILLGKFWGKSATGLYTNAHQVLLAPMANIRGPIMAIAVPSLSTLQDQHERFDRYAGKIVFLLAFLTMPIMTFCAVFADEMVLLIFGPKWVSMIPLFRVLAITGAIQPVLSIRGSILIPYGESKLALKMQTIVLIVSSAGVAAGIAWGTLGVAIGYGIGLVLSQIYALGSCFSNTPLQRKTFLDNAVPCAVASLIACGGSLLIRSLIPGQWPLPTLVAEVPLAVGIYALLSLRVPLVRTKLDEVVALVRKRKT